MSSPNIQNPFLPASQWTQGEPIDDLIMHRRTDEQFDVLAAYIRQWSRQWASCWARMTVPGVSVVAGAQVPFDQVRIDNASKFTPGIGTAGGFYTTPWAGQYICGFQITQNGTASQMAGDLNLSDGRIIGTPVKASATSQSVGLSMPLRIAAGIEVFVTSTFALVPEVAAGYSANYMFVQQVGW